jgi:hypothetical protein
MIRDLQNTFATEQAITVDAISHVIDLGPLGAGNTIRDIGAGKTLYLHVLVTTGLDSAGEAATLQVTLESDSTADLATSATVHWDSGTLTEAALATAGTWIAKGIAIPAGAYERYLGLRFNNATEAFTSGKVSAWLSENRYDDRTYENAWSTGVN